MPLVKKPCAEDDGGVAGDVAGDHERVRTTDAGPVPAVAVGVGKEDVVGAGVDRREDLVAVARGVGAGRGRVPQVEARARDGRRAAREQHE